MTQANNVPATYGKNLSSVLKKNSITQRELAKRTGLDESTISLYISNRRTPSLKNHIKLCKALEIDSNFFGS